MPPEAVMTVRRIPELVVPGHRLGRVINHDPRSLAYLVEPTDTAPVSRSHRRYVPIFDQGATGSCTGQAAAGTLGTAPLYGTLTAQRKAGLVLDEAEAVSIYSDAERLDGGAGLPTEDNGSSGLSVAKVARARGLISSYLHITSLAAAHTAILTGPFLVGSNWYTGMDSPNAAGLVTVGGTIRGGHEYEAVAYSALHGLWKLANSWSALWGKAGCFYLTDRDLARLLGEDGDATVFQS